MFDVNLYIATSNRGIQAKDGHYIYILEYMTSKEVPCTLSGRGYIEKASQKRMILTAILEAVRRINKACDIRVFTECEGILAPLKNGWLETWKENGFLTAKKEPVKDADLWEQLSILLEKHLIHEENAEHTYRNWMESELRKEQEKRREKAEASDDTEEIKKAWEEAWSLNPDKDLQPRGLVLMAIKRKNGIEYLLYKENAENGEIKYWYDSRREQEVQEAGWSKR